MNAKKWALFALLIFVGSILLPACGEKEVEVTRVVTEKETVVETVVEKETVEVEKVVTATPEPVTVREVKNPDKFTILMKGDVRTLDPQWQFDSSGNQAALLLYDKLIMYKGEGLTEYEPLLATEVPSWENGLITEGDDGAIYYDFPIREGVKFHNGETLTAEDIKYTFLRLYIQDRSGGGAYVTMPALTGGPYTIEGLAKSVTGVDDFEQIDEEGLIKTFEVLDEAITVHGNTLRFRLPRPFAPFLTTLGGTWNDGIVSKKCVTELGGWPGTAETWKDFHDPAEADSVLYDAECGSGPFKLVNWDRTAAEVTYERFDDYWAGPAKLERVVQKYIPEFATMKLMLQAGDADYIDSEYSTLPQLEGMDGVRVVKGLPTLRERSVQFQWNVSEEGSDAIGSGKLDGEGIPPDFFSDINVRTGFSYAFDYETYLADVWNNEAQLTTGPLLEGMVGWGADQPRYSYDPEKAEEYFRKAYDGELWEVGFKFTAFTPDRYADTGKAILDILKEGLLSINPKFQMDVQMIQWSAYFARRTGQSMPIWIGYLGLDYPDSDNAVSLFMESGYYLVPHLGPNFVAFAEEELDPLILQARVSGDVAEREQLYDQLQKLWYDNALSIFLEQGVGSLVTRDWVQGLYKNPCGQSIAFKLHDVSKGY